MAYDPLGIDTEEYDPLGINEVSDTRPPVDYSVFDTIMEDVKRTADVIGIPLTMPLAWAASGVSGIVAKALTGDEEFANQIREDVGKQTTWTPKSEVGKAAMEFLEPGFRDVSKLARQMTGSVRMLPGVNVNPDEPLFSGKLYEHSPIEDIAALGAEAWAFKQAGKVGGVLKSEVKSGVRAAKESLRSMEEGLKFGEEPAPEIVRPESGERPVEPIQKPRETVVAKQEYDPLKINEEKPVAETLPEAKVEPPVAPIVQTGATSGGKQPWEMDKTSVKAGLSDELIYRPTSLSDGTLAFRDFDSGKTIVGDKYFELDPVGRKSLLIHEVGHDISKAILADKTQPWVDLMEPLRVQDGTPRSVRSQWKNPVGGSTKPEEILADIYGDIKENGMPNFAEGWSKETAEKLGPVYERVAKEMEVKSPPGPRPGSEPSPPEIVELGATSGVFYHAKTKGEFTGGRPSVDIGSDADIMGRGFYVSKDSEYAARYGTPEPYNIEGNFANTKQWTDTLKKHENKPIAEQRSLAREELQAQGYDGVMQEGGNGVIWNQGVLDKPGAPAEGKPEGATGIKNAQTLAEREARGLSEVEVETRRSNLVAFDEGKRRIESGEVDPRLLAEELSKKPRPLTPEETAMLTIDRQRIKTDHKAAMDAVEKARDSGDTIAEAEARVKLSEVEEVYNTNDIASRLTGYEQGAGLQARKMMVDEDMSLAAMLQKQRVESGKPVTPEMRAKFEELSKRYEEVNAKLKTLEESKAQREADITVKRIQNEVAKEQRQTKRTYAKEELSTEFSGLVKELNSVLGGQLNVGLDPAAVVVLGKMAKNRVKSGVITIDGIVDEVYSAVKEIGFEISKRDIRDAISGYGITSQMSKEAIAVQLRELKRQMRLISAFEDAKAGQVPLRSGLQRDLPSDTVRELGRKVQQAMRESGVDSTKVRSPEEQWKTSIDAVKTRLNNSIADITKEIESGERLPKSKGITYDAEAKALRERRDALATLRDALVEEPKEFTIEEPGTIPVQKTRQLTQEQRINAAIRAAEKATGRYSEMAAKGNLFPEKKVSTILETPELIEARNRRTEMKEYLDELREIANPKRTPEEIALKSFKTRTTNRITELEQKLANKDFTKQEKRQTALDPEALALKFQLDKVTRSYHEAMTKDRLANRSTLQKIGGGIGEAINLSRAIKTSFDLSAVLRQGAFIVFGHPIRGAKSIPAMFKALMSEKGQFAVDLEIRNRPNYRLYEQGKLYLAEHGQKLSQMEEVYMSRWAEKIPGVAASQRAYTAFLNKLRADSFDTMWQNLSVKGKPTPQELNAIANYVNVATGRGNLGAKENALVGLNTAFFAPRYVASRFQLLAGQPLYRGSAATRTMIAGEYARFLTGLGVVYSLGAAAGADIEIDPRSSDFGKIKFGNVRVDPMAGISQSTVLVARLLSGETKTSTGNIVPIRGDNVPYGSGNSADVIARFLRSKLSPVVGTGVDIAAGKDIVGQRVTAEALPEKLLAPLAFNDIYQTMKEQGVPAAAALGILSMFGMGLQTYNSQQRNSDTIFDTFRQDVMGEPPQSMERGVRAARQRMRAR